MAQVSTTTSNVHGITTSALQTSINNLRTKFVQGQTIYAADINSVVSLYNTWITHDHTVNDILFVAFGNTPTYPADVNEARTSLSVKGTSTSAVSVSVGGSVLSATHNSIAALVNAIRNHTHTITDKVQT